jgi:hypothetical protein
VTVEVTLMPTVTFARTQSGRTTTSSTSGSTLVVPVPQESGGSFHECTGPYLKTSSTRTMYIKTGVYMPCTHQRSARVITFSGTRSRTKIVYVALANAQRHWIIGCPVRGQTRVLWGNRFCTTT